MFVHFVFQIVCENSNASEVYPLPQKEIRGEPGATSKVFRVLFI